jgi:hypothetical protein
LEIRFHPWLNSGVDSLCRGTGLNCGHEWRTILHAAGGLSTSPDAARESIPPVRRVVLLCGSYQLRLVSMLDEEAGELALVLVCKKCDQKEILPVR